MTTETEHRGWEISSDYHEHWMDDCTYDLAEDTDSPWQSWLAAIAIAVLVAGVYLLGKWLEPPAVTFRPPIISMSPVQPAVQFVSQFGDFRWPVNYSVTCMALDTQAKTIQPIMVLLDSIRRGD